jgi:hypothetical protein
MGTETGGVGQGRGFVDATPPGERDEVAARGAVVPRPLSFLDHLLDAEITQPVGLRSR